MNLEELIAVSDFCKGHGISQTFIIEMKEYGLVEIVQRKNTWYMPIHELPKAERIIRLHADLEINFEGIEVITQLLNRIVDMEEEMARLRNRLKLYE